MFIFQHQVGNPLVDACGKVVAGRWREDEGRVDCKVARGAPALAPADLVHEVLGADGLLLVGEDPALADHGGVLALLVHDEAGGLLSGDHHFISNQL